MSYRTEVKGFAIGPDTHQVYKLPTRKYLGRRLTGSLTTAVALRQQSVPVPPHTGPIKILSLWTIRALCADGKEYSLKGEVQGPASVEEYLI
jgi:hypothetical protein